MNELYLEYLETYEDGTMEDVAELEEERREMAYDAWREEQLCNK